MQELRNTPLSLPASPQKVARQLREVFREAFDQLGGAAWLVEFATKSDSNARVFVQAISKLLPATRGPDDRPTQVIVDIPWLTRDRLAYKNAEKGNMDSDVTDLLPRQE